MLFRSVGGTTYTFSNVTANRTIAVTFAIDTFTITASSNAGGSVTPSGTTTVNYGASQTYTVTPATGYHVASVLVDGTTATLVGGTTYTFSNVTANRTIAVTFAIDTFTIDASSGPHGSISPSGSTTVAYGSSQAYTVTPQVDTPEMLDRFGKERGINPAVWKLVTGDAKRIYGLARQSYFADDSRLEDQPSGAEDFLHTEKALLVDQQGRIRGVYNATVPHDIENLIADIGVLGR